jgi:choline dehydrogenase-like flavoprotein
LFLDARSFPPGHRLEADLCIVGGGAAGITLASEFVGSPLRVLLLESGGASFETATQELYQGPFAGPLVGPDSDYLRSTRLRYWGGSTNHWNGWCRPLDYLDFEPRPWLGLEGWPIRRSDLEPYYLRALPILWISPFDVPEHRRPGKPLFGGRGPLATSFFHLSRPIRFGAYREVLEPAANLGVVFHANVKELILAPNGQSVERLGGATLEGPGFSVRAREFVLATGGIENARLLLLSHGVQATGIGNQHDLVGRHFMDHPHGKDAATVLFPGLDRQLGLYRGWFDRRRGHRVQGVFVPTPAAQRELAIPNGLIHLNYFQNLPLAERGDEVAELFRSLEGIHRDDGQPDAYAAVQVTIEPRPARASRVTLADEPDALGSRRARL